MRILLIDPPGPWTGVNTGLAYLCSVLRQNHEVRVLELAVPGPWAHRPVEAVLQTIGSFSPQVVGLSAKSPTWRISQEIATQVHRVAPDTFIVVGGAHATLAQESLLQCPAVDAVIMMEGEDALPQLLDRLGGDLSLVKGIAFRNGDGVVKTEGQGWIRDLDALPFPDFTGFGLSSHDYYPLITSRGCPYQCIYCAVGQVSGKRFRWRSPENIVAELEQAREKYGTGKFKVDDDCFSLHLPRAKRFCDLLVERKLNMKWTCNNGIRADRLDAELAHKMKAAGCTSVAIGIESPLEDIFATINKGESLEDIRRGIRFLKEAGLKTKGTFIIGLPGDNPDKAKKALSIAKTFKLDVMTWNNIIPYPGTAVRSWAQQHARILRDYEESAQHLAEVKPVFDTPDFPEAERIKAYERANLVSRNYHPFYLRKPGPSRNDAGESTPLAWQPHSIKDRVEIALRLLGFIIRYDLLNLPVHLWALGKTFVQSKLTHPSRLT